MTLSLAEPVEVPTHIARFGDHVELVSGYAFDAKHFGESGDLPIVRIRDIARGVSKTYYSGDFEEKYLLRDGDLLIGMDGEFNRGTWNGGAALLNQRVCKIVADSTTLDPRYMYHFLPGALKAIEAITPFATVKHLSAKTIREIAIPLPSLFEQRQIAAILDQADELRAQRRRAIALLDELASAYFQSAFDLPASVGELKSLPRLEDFALQITDGEHQTPRRTKAGKKLLSARNIQDGYLDFSSVDYVDDAEYERIVRRCKPGRGDVLISCSGSVGRVVAVATDEPFVLVRSVALVRPTDDLDPVYLEWFLRSSLIQNEIRKSAKSSAQANLFQGPIKSLPILVPSIEAQRAFAQFIARIQELRTCHQVHLESLDCLFASLQQRAFRGDL